MAAAAGTTPEVLDQLFITKPALNTSFFICHIHIGYAVKRKTGNARMPNTRDGAKSAKPLWTTCQKFCPPLV